MKFRLTFGMAALVVFALSVQLAIAAEDNLIVNPDFDKELAPWTSYGAVTLSLSKRGDAYEGSHALQAVIAQKGVNFWDSGIQYKPNIVFDKNTQYTWAMFFKSDPPVEINIKPELGVDPWTAYGEKRAQLTGDWAEYFTEFKPPVDVVPASLTLHVGFAPATIWIDNARWYEGKYAPASGEPQAVDPAGKLATTWSQLKSR